MSEWNPAEARAITAPEEVRVAPRRLDGSLRRPRTIWIVGDGDRVFIRSTNGPTADWFRGALVTGAGQIVAGRTAYDVTFTPAEPADLPSVDTAYRKYGRYASIVEHLLGPGPRAATLHVHPA